MNISPQRFYATKMVMLAIGELQEQEIFTDQITREIITTLALQYGYSAQLCAGEVEGVLDALPPFLEPPAKPRGVHRD